MASPCLQKLPAVEHLFALTSFKLPEIPCSLSFQRHPDYMSITKEANEWAFKCMRRDFSPEEKKCLVQWKVPMFTCLSTPHAPKANMLASAKFAWLTAFLDDPFDDNEVAGGALATSYLDTLLSLCYGTASLAEVPDILAYRACHDLMEDLRSLFKPELFRRTVSTVEGWARSILSDDLTHEYELYRRTNVFILPLIYAMGASFDDEDVESLDYIRAQNAMLDHMWMVNDVFSFPKEFYKKKFNNLPAVLLLTDPSVQTFQDAVNTTCRMIQDKEDEFIYYRDILASVPEWEESFPEVPGCSLLHNPSESGAASYRSLASLGKNATPFIPDTLHKVWTNCVFTPGNGTSCGDLQFGASERELFTIKRIESFQGANERNAWRLV
ncbi:(E)-2-epi-beta-caryophyllene synthase-like [Selaginella moellendorffii]|uniref:(E)-2-epi-beta-caryophyllene synthase-like n=1 Tax=Selaginella moellendorffii TaxID=88036 RepID=UPI000D1CD50D|nr:(E)-2-epi-beta-caryophyllene synthase-like [Selaginella moellendorffii]|eukprot:XP_024542662.1 (E)-2-epi-beta-caryophyllene synthase-like [Selaginella moellendorffii]